MLGMVLLEGIGLSVILLLICAFGIRKGAVEMVYLYHKDVQDRCVSMGLTTHDKIEKDGKVFKIGGIILYLVYTLVCVYAVNGARGFLQGFWQMFLILSVLNIIDRIFIDEVWVGYTKAWTIPGTEDLKPYINGHDRCRKWLGGTVGMAILSAILAGIFSLIL